MLFNIGNMTVWACCLSASFGWDERTAPVVLVFMMNAFLMVLMDATCSDFEYGGSRSIFLIFITLMCFSGKCTVVRGVGAIAFEEEAGSSRDHINAVGSNQK